MTRSATKWLLIIVGLIISADVFGSRLHLSALYRQEIIVTVFVFGVVVIAGRRYWRAKWFWLLVLFLTPFHLIVLWADFRLYPTLLESDNIAIWLVAIAELWVFQRCVLLLDSKYGHGLRETRR